jgi:Arc/MetJ family transcription regulator
MYASFLDFCAPCIWTFLNSLSKIKFFNNLLRGEAMRTTLNIDDSLIDKASKMTGIKEKTALVKLGLEALIARESGKRLARLGGTQKQLEAIPRRKGA